MASTSLTGSSSGKGFTIVVDPRPGDVAKQISRKVNKPMSKEIGRLNKKYGKIPVDEIKKRADALGSGRSRIGKAVRASATKRDLTVAAGGARFPDFAGQEFGSQKYGQFLPWKGNSADAGYVINPLMQDEQFMTEFGEKYVDGFTELIERVLPASN